MHIFAFYLTPQLKIHFKECGISLFSTEKFWINNIESLEQWVSVSREQWQRKTGMVMRRRKRKDLKLEQPWA